MGTPYMEEQIEERRGLKLAHHSRATSEKAMSQANKGNPGIETAHIEAVWMGDTHGHHCEETLSVLCGIVYSFIRSLIHFTATY